MSTRGWEHATPHDVRNRRTGTTMPQTRSKYRNVRTVVGTEIFDSKREAAYWQGLLARQSAGEIQNLRRQVCFPLLCPVEDRAVMVAFYVADFVYEEQGKRHVVDAKGHRTQMYKLKAKWLALQDGVVVEEV